MRNSFGRFTLCKLRTCINGAADKFDVSWYNIGMILPVSMGEAYRAVVHNMCLLLPTIAVLTATVATGVLKKWSVWIVLGVVLLELLVLPVVLIVLYFLSFILCGD